MRWIGATRWPACAERKNVGKLDGFKGRISILAGATNDAEVIKRAVAGCDGVLVVLVPPGRPRVRHGHGRVLRLAGISDIMAYSLAVAPARGEAHDG